MTTIDPNLHNRTGRSDISRSSENGPVGGERSQPLFSIPRLVLVLATVLAGLSAGFFFTYEASVTLGLADVGDEAYVETFQAINETIRNPGFGIVFFGSIPAIALAIALNWRSIPAMARAFMTAALPLYLAGVVITATGNVPLNNDLADIALAGVEDMAPAIAAEARADFEDDWNRLNLLRTITFGASFAALVTGATMAPTKGNGRDVPADTGHTG